MVRGFIVGVVWKFGISIWFVRWLLGKFRFFRWLLRKFRISCIVIIIISCSLSRILGRGRSIRRNVKIGRIVEVG